MNKFWKYLIFVLVAVALFFGGMLLEGKFQNDRYKEVSGWVRGLDKEKEKNLKETQIKYEKSKNEVFRLCIEVSSIRKNYAKQLEKETAELQDSIARNKQNIIYLKIKSDEKVDSIRVLPLDSAMEFFADQVSREDSPQR